MRLSVTVMGREVLTVDLSGPVDRPPAESIESQMSGVRLRIEDDGGRGIARICRREEQCQARRG